MKETTLEIRKLQRNEIPQLAGFAPVEWQTDLPQLFSLHYDQPYFTPVVVKRQQQIVGIGCGILNGKVGWLGNIIVAPDYRRQGIGLAITRRLVAFFKRKGCTTQLLIATRMGEDLYRKLGFTVSSSYVFYRCERPVISQPSEGVRPFQPSDFPLTAQIDREASGEARLALIQRFFGSGWVFDAGGTNGVEGFYLPDFGSGLIVARNAEAGIALLGFKTNRGVQTIVLPEANSVGRAFLTRCGYAETSRSPRMVLGEELDWRPDLIYSRAAGYCG
jgi:GNAT superfamily N-acetyltransferase